MSLYGPTIPTFHVTPVDLCIILKCNLYISCIMSCGNKIVSNCFKFPIAILNGTCFFPTVQLRVHNDYLKRNTRNI